MNRWKGSPKGSDTLCCRYCKTFITTYDEYIETMVHRDVTRTMVKYADPDSDQQIEILKKGLCKKTKE